MNLGTLVRGIALSVAMATASIAGDIPKAKIIVEKADLGGSAQVYLHKDGKPARRYSATCGMAEKILAFPGYFMAAERSDTPQNRHFWQYIEEQLERVHQEKPIPEDLKLGAYHDWCSKKMREGDFKTPEGEYYVVSKHPSDKYGYFIGISYPNIEDAKRGLESRLISQREYDAIVEANKKHQQPPWNTAIGGAVGIHGRWQKRRDGSRRPGKPFYKAFWDYLDPGGTAGCIELRPTKGQKNPIAELYGLVSVGDKIVIRREEHQ